MTRARETLQLLELDRCKNPHTHHLDGQHVEKRRIEIPGRTATANKRYHILGMKDLYLGYAGNFHGNHRIHAALKKCTMGDWLKPVIRDKHIYLADSDETLVARLSKAARDTWLPKIDSIQGVNVLAMVRWGKADISDKAYSEHCRCDIWEIPVCELVYE